MRNFSDILCAGVAGFLLVAVLLLGACSTTDVSNVDEDKDGPGGHVDADAVDDAIARREPFSRYGNPPSYEVNGVRYTVLDSNKGYVEKGNASWYGKKFHGRRTSSGEVFDMYKATAAHRSLPLPTYAYVTNLDNGKTLLVKINDRGPFHSDRIIDLSYAAAVKLGFANAGIGYVEVRAINFDQASAKAPPATDETPGTARVPLPATPQQTYIQIGAFKYRVNAQAAGERLQAAGFSAVSVDQAQSLNGDPLYKVRMGPYDSLAETDAVISQLQAAGITGFSLLDN